MNPTKFSMIIKNLILNKNLHLNKSFTSPFNILFVPQLSRTLIFRTQYENALTSHAYHGIEARTERDKSIRKSDISIEKKITQN